jgi:hypothetical protein
LLHDQTGGVLRKIARPREKSYWLRAFAARLTGICGEMRPVIPAGRVDLEFGVHLRYQIHAFPEVGVLETGRTRRSTNRRHR